MWNKSVPWHLADLHSFSHNFEALLLFCSARSNFRALSTWVASLWLYMKPFWWLSLVGLLHVLEVMILSSENYTLNLNLVASIMGVENILMTRSSLLTPPENVWDVPLTLAVNKQVMLKCSHPSSAMGQWWDGGILQVVLFLSEIM